MTGTRGYPRPLGQRGRGAQPDDPEQHDGAEHGAQGQAEQRPTLGCSAHHEQQPQAQRVAHEEGQEGTAAEHGQARHALGRAQDPPTADRGQQVGEGQQAERPARRAATRAHNTRSQVSPIRAWPKLWCFSRAMSVNPAFS